MRILASARRERLLCAALGANRKRKHSIISAAIVLGGLAAPCWAGYSFNMLADLTADPHPYAGLTFDNSGNLYGTTQLGGTGNYGTVYKLAGGSHAFSVVADLSYDSGYYTYGNLVVDSSGNIFGVGASGGGTGGNPGAVFEVPSGSNSASKLATLPDSGGGGDGGLVMDGAGNLYGAEYRSGSSPDGSIYKVDAVSHTSSVLASFNGTNGSAPFASLSLDNDGNLYGTTRAGGDNNLGTVFKYSTADHAITSLASFGGTNGSGPSSKLVFDSAGNMYGTASSGGAYGHGVIFELAAGSDTIVPLASFTGANGSDPLAGLLLDAKGNLFGTASAGGLYDCGTVFELPAGSSIIKDLYAFRGPDGWSPSSALVADNGGNLYGTTYLGGSGWADGSRGEGTAFELAFVPEPGTCLLIAVVGSLAFLRRRRVPEN